MMNNKILAILILVIMLSLAGCKSETPESGDKAPESSQGTQTGDSEEQAEEDSVEETNENGEFFFKAKVKGIDQKKYLEVEIIDSAVAFGDYRVLVGDATEYFDKDGKVITREDIKVGDTIVIIFSGQVMLSNPPQISAIKITKE